MYYFKFRALVLAIMIQAIVGCGGGGGGSGGVSSDNVVPIVNVFTMPATSASLTSTTVPISSLSASDAVGVTGYLVNESATPPSPDPSIEKGWTSTAPSNFTFSSGGIKTAYAWAKDAVGNVSSSRSANINFTGLKTATLKFSAQSTNPTDSIAGFLLTVNLPLNSFLPIDSARSTVSGTVAFAGVSLLFDNFYDTILLQLNSNYIFSGIQVSQFINLGQFITILVTVPVGYTPNVDDITYSFAAKNPSGTALTTISVTPTFN